MASSSSRPNRVPRILLVGAGKFGMLHLRVLSELHAEGVLEFAGVVVRNPELRKTIEENYGLTTYSALTPKLARSVDAVDIVTPPETHYALVKQCLPHTNVLVEKPLAMNERESLALESLARTHGRMLMVGHIFRFHPVTLALAKVLQDRPLPKCMEGSFVNPIATDVGREASFELLHLFDVIDFLWKKIPKSVFAHQKARLTTVDARYGTSSDARFTLGWDGERKERTLQFKYPEETIVADYMAGTVTHIKGKKAAKVIQAKGEEPLRKELKEFVLALKTKKSPVAGAVGARIVSIASRAVPRTQSISAKDTGFKIAVIGGGIFGTNIAMELSNIAGVTLFEKNTGLLQEGSYVNQMRHHLGYHYPRSNETVEEVQKSLEPFEALYEKAILRDAPTFYSIAREGSLVTSEEFKQFCKRHKLAFTKAKVPNHLLSESEIELSFKVTEPRYDLGILKGLVEKYLKAKPQLTVRKGWEVTSCSIRSDGKKTLTYKTPHGIKTEDFDIVINATYARINQFASALNFALVPIRVDHAEALIITLPIDPICITVIDGPFATLMPTGNKNEFVLYHALESMHDRYVPEDGRIRRARMNITREKEIIEACTILFPILKDAVVVESRIVHRGVIANHEYDDRRTADIFDHGFGCYSVLSGKILTSVYTGGRLRDIVGGTSPTKNKKES
ncbi:MAG: FAD-dependent oxidoreductase [Candidatus Paceibacterota bacterium]